MTTPDTLERIVEDMRRFYNPPYEGEPCCDWCEKVRGFRQRIETLIHPRLVEHGVRAKDEAYLPPADVETLRRAMDAWFLLCDNPQVDDVGMPVTPCWKCAMCDTGQRLRAIIARLEGKP